MIAEFPAYIGVKLSTDQHTVVRTLASREQTTVSAVLRKLIEAESKRDLQQGKDGHAQD